MRYQIRTYLLRYMLLAAIASVALVRYRGFAMTVLVYWYAALAVILIPLVLVGIGARLYDKVIGNRSHRHLP